MFKLNYTVVLGLFCLLSRLSAPGIEVDNSLLATVVQGAMEGEASRVTHLEIDIRRFARIPLSISRRSTLREFVEHGRTFIKNFVNMLFYSLPAETPWKESFVAKNAAENLCLIVVVAIICLKYPECSAEEDIMSTIISVLSCYDILISRESLSDLIYIIKATVQELYPMPTKDSLWWALPRNSFAEILPDYESIRYMNLIKKIFATKYVLPIEITTIENVAITNEQISLLDRMTLWFVLKFALRLCGGRSDS